MNKVLEKAQNTFIEYICEICDDFGLNRFIAQLYAVLYLHDKPMSLDEIVGQLGASKGNVSLNIRELERWGAVKKVWVKGSRRDYYEAQQDIRQLFLSKFKISIQKRLDDARIMITDFNNILASSNSELMGEDKELIKVYKEKLKKVEEMVNLGEDMLKLAGAVISKG